MLWRHYVAIVHLLVSELGLSTQRLLPIVLRQPLGLLLIRSGQTGIPLIRQRRTILESRSERRFAVVRPGVRRLVRKGPVRVIRVDVRRSLDHLLVLPIPLLLLTKIC